MFKRIVVLLIISTCSFQTFGWGITGHRTVGFIAEKYLSKKAKKKINKLLNGRSLAVVSTWMDEVRSDSRYDYAETWHWVTIPEGLVYEKTEKNPDGDIIESIIRIEKELKSESLGKEKEAEALKMLVHLIGDIHQPLHVGTGEDMGGNQRKVKWFWDNTNLHSVWDTKMIASQEYSYTELAESIDYFPENMVESWQEDPLATWVEESMSLRNQVYDLPEDNNLKYEYRYKNWATVEKRLMQAGVRLAAVLNEIYG